MVHLHMNLEYYFSVPVNVDVDGGVDMKDLHKKIEQHSSDLVIFKS